MDGKDLNVSSSSDSWFVTITELSNVDRNVVHIVDDFSKHYKILIYEYPRIFRYT